MHHGLYAASLIFGIAGIACIDYRYQLAWFYDKRRTVRTIVPSIVLFIAWDVVGILLGIFADGDGWYRSGIELMRDFPIEEILFLLLLTYCSLVVWRFIQQKTSASVGVKS